MYSKKIRLMLLPAVVAGVLMTAACGGDDSSSGSGGTGGANAPAAGEGIYIQTLKAAGVDVSDEDAVIAQGKEVCEKLASGVDPVDAIKQVDPNLDLPQQSMLTGAAIASFCPDQESKLTGQ